MVKPERLKQSLRCRQTCEANTQYKVGLQSTECGGEADTEENLAKIMTLRVFIRRKHSPPTNKGTNLKSVELLNIKL
jgi:hypothetical protein